MKKKRIALFFVFLALCLGVYIGFSLEGYAKRQLFNLLDGEIKASTSCHLEVSSISISFLTLSVETKKPVMVCNGQKKMALEKVTARFDIAEIFQKRILLYDLNLINGVIEEIAPDSEVFRFIYHLSASSPPEQSTSNRWRLKLMTMNVLNAEFTQQFGQRVLTGKGGHLSFRKDEHDVITLIPGFKNLYLQSADPKTNIIELGNVSSRIVSDDVHTEIAELKLAYDDIWAQITGNYVDKTDEINAKANYRISSSYLQLPRWLQAVVSGEAIVKGDVDSPLIEGGISSKDIKIEKEESPVQKVSDLNASYKIHFQDGAPIINVDSLHAFNDTVDVSLAAPLCLKGGELSGGLQLSASSLKVGGRELSGVKARIDFGNLVTNPSLSINSTIEKLVLDEKLFVPGIKLSGAYKDKQFNFQVSKDTGVHEVFRTEGILRVSDNNSEAFLDIPKLELEDLEFFGEASPLVINATGRLSGPFDVSKLEGSVQGRLEYGDFQDKEAISASLTLKNGKLLGQFRNPSGAISGQIKFDDILNKREGDLKLSLQGHDLEKVFPPGSCPELQGNADYKFSLETLLQGTGQIQLQAVSLGCDEDRVSLHGPAIIPIQKGVLKAGELKISSHNTTLALRGDISLEKGFNLSASGSLDLASFLPLTPSLDDLGGSVSAEFQVQGDLAKPTLQGQLVIANGHLGIESKNLSAYSINGVLQLSGEELVFSNVKGEFNEGDFSIQGALVPLNIKASRLKLSFDDVSYEPDENTVLIAGGDLSLHVVDRGPPILEGTVNIKSAQYQQNLDIPTLLRSVSDLLFSRQKEFQGTSSGVLPSLNLNVKVKARRNLFILTNFFGAEAKSDLSVLGDLNNPKLSGNAEVLYGWFGLKERRFAITNCVIAFQPASMEPSLDLIGETKLYSSVGDPVLVIFEAKGPLTHPFVNLSSDQGLSQQQILNLLATGQGAINPTLVDTIGGDLEDPSSFSLFGLLPVLKSSRFLADLTRINSLYFEPQLNPLTGVVEPVAIAKKDFGNRMSILGEAPFGERRTGQKVKGIYNLTPSLNVAGTFTAASVDERASLGVDLGYTILAKTRPLVLINMKGNREFTQPELMKGLKLSESVHLERDDLLALEREMKAFYRKAGFFETDVSSNCTSKNDGCLSVDFAISEGPESKVREVSFEGDNPIEILGAKSPSIKIGKAATSDYLEEVRTSLTSALRNEGYIGARVETKYVALENLTDVALKIKSWIGSPVSFSFIGNKKFGPGDFLRTINLFNRRLPFGRNTVNILMENITVLYRQAGYLYVRISKEEQVSEKSGRINYIITVNEGSKVNVEDVLLTGNSQISERQMKKAVSESGEKEYRAMFNPSFAVDEEIKAHSDFLKSFYKKEGFADVVVDYRIEPGQKKNTAKIIYQINEGKSLRKKWIILSGLPAGNEIPEGMKAEEYSIPQANEFIADILNSLRNEAYLNATVTTELDVKAGTMKVTFVPGEKTHVEGIEIEGNSRISRETIIENLTFKENDPWSPKIINESKLRLLRLGLFSNVDMSEGPRIDHGRILKIKVTEKPLQTLQLGGGVNSEYGLHIFGEGKDTSLFKDGRSLSLRIDTYYDRVAANISRGIADLRYLDPSFMGSSYSFTQDLRYLKEQIPTQEFDLNRVSLSSFFYKVTDTGLTLSGGHTVFQENLDNVSPGAIISKLDSGVVNISTLSGSLSYDRRNSTLSPTKGYFLSLDSSNASSFIGSDADYYTLGTKASYLTPLHFLSNQVIFSAATRIVSGWAYRGTQEIPISQRFYAGGRTSVRGFAENSLGPRGSDGSVIGGDFLSVSNLQLDYLIAESVSVHSFLDLGNVFLKDRKIDFENLRRGTGFGVQYMSPIGPIGIDVGFPLDRHSGESVYRIYFTVGSMF